MRGDGAEAKGGSHHARSTIASVIGVLPSSVLCKLRLSAPADICHGDDIRAWRRIGVGVGRMDVGGELRRAQQTDVEAIRNLTRAAYAKWVPVIGREPKPMGADYESAAPGSSAGASTI